MEPYTYTVFVDDNYHHGDESERYKLGVYPTCEAATEACKEVVDEVLTTNLNFPGDLLATWLMFGDDPFILTDDPACKFSARDYARQRVQSLRPNP
jgi:hypothetical protein